MITWINYKIKCKWSTNSIKILYKIPRKKNNIIHKFKLNNNSNLFRDLFLALQYNRYNSKLPIKDNSNNLKECFRSSYLICIIHLFSILTCHNKSKTKSKVRILNVYITLLINESKDHQFRNCKKAQFKNKDKQNSLNKVKINQYNNHEEWWFKILFNNNNQKDKEDLLLKTTKILYVKD